jgi:hypothetical protein
MQKSLVVFHGTAATRGDQKALYSGLSHLQNMHVEQVELKDLDHDVKSYPIEDYDTIVLPWFGSALYASFGTVRDTLQYVFDHARPYAICIPYAEITFGIDPNVWNEGDLSSKSPVYASKPVCVIGAFDKGILGDKNAMERITKNFMRKIHNESIFTTCPWESFFSYFLPDELHDVGFTCPVQPDLFHPAPPRVHRFYYGANKPSLVESLKSMGLGEDPDDAVFGNIKKALPDVRDLSLSVKKNTWNHANTWAWFARNADELLVPYEPVKGDWLLTKRFIEAEALASDHVSYDHRINPTLIEAAKRGTDYADEILEDLATILEGRTA